MTKKVIFFWLATLTASFLFALLSTAEAGRLSPAQLTLLEKPIESMANDITVDDNRLEITIKKQSENPDFHFQVEQNSRLLVEQNFRLVAEQNSRPLTDATFNTLTKILPDFDFSNSAISGTYLVKESRLTHIQTVIVHNASGAKMINRLASGKFVSVDLSPSLQETPVNGLRCKTIGQFNKGLLVYATGSESKTIIYYYNHVKALQQAPCPEQVQQLSSPMISEIGSFGFLMSGHCTYGEEDKYLNVLFRYQANRPFTIVELPTAIEHLQSPCVEELRNFSITGFIIGELPPFDKKLSNVDTLALYFYHKIGKNRYHKQADLPQSLIDSLQKKQAEKNWDPKMLDEDTKTDSVCSHHPFTLEDKNLLNSLYQQLKVTKESILIPSS